MSSGMRFFKYMSVAALVGLKTTSFAFAISHISKGGESSVGGGNSVVCFDSPSIIKLVEDSNHSLKNQFLPHVVSVEALDLWTARRPLKPGDSAPRLIEPLAGETVPHYIERIIQRLSVKAPEAAEILLEGHNQTFGQANEYPTVRWSDGLNYINDHKFDTTLLPSHCTLVTFAAQQGVNEATRLKLDRRFFSEGANSIHPVFSQAVLLIHEYVYMRARSREQVDSRAVRMLVRYLISEDPDYSAQEIHQTLTELDLVSSKQK